MPHTRYTVMINCVRSTICIPVKLWRSGDYFHTIYSFA